MIAFPLLLTFLQLASIDSSPLPPSCRQLLLVLTSSYEATQGALHKFQRSNASASWERVESPVPIVVGRSGLGWGEGLHTGIPPDRPVKREGDGRSPAGVFALGTAFGFPARAELEPLRFPYLQITEPLECVDDSQSQHYNALIDRTQAGESDWHSSEKMFEIKTEYQLGVFVEHNVQPRRPGFGSCIFLHVWSAPSNPTIGCTAMAGTDMQKIVSWLEEEAKPVLVQLPQEEYAGLRQAWQLPAVTASAPLKTKRVEKKAAHY